MKLERVIFLDCDGVLNHVGTFRAYRAAGTPSAFPLDQDACDLFRGVCEATGAKAVLSSAWRGIPEGERLLRDRGALKHWHRDKRTKQLPYHSGHTRGAEIAEWLSRHPEVTEYAIVDDDSDMLPEQMPRFVQTDFEAGGLTKAHADRLIALFSAEQTQVQPAAQP